MDGFLAGWMDGGMEVNHISSPGIVQGKLVYSSNQTKAKILGCES